MCDASAVSATHLQVRRGRSVEDHKTRLSAKVHGSIEEAWVEALSPPGQSRVRYHGGTVQHSRPGTRTGSPSNFLRFAFRLMLAVYLLASLGLPSALQAGVVAFVGAQTDMGSGWRTVGLLKNLDADGNNVLGSDGYYLFGLSSSKQPPYIQTWTPTSSVYPGNSAYSMVDNPVTTPGASPTTEQSGTANPTPGTNVGTSILTFKMSGAGGSLPYRLRVGVMIDNVGGSTYNASSVRIFQVGGSGDSGQFSLSAAVYNDKNPDWVFFDITGAQVNDTYELEAFGGALGIATVGAVSFDSMGAPGAVTNVGSLTDLGAGWRTAGVLKSLDVDGNNVLGSDGWYLFGGTDSSTSMPAYVSSWTPTSSIYPGNSVYFTIDDPTTTPGASPSTERSGTANPWPGPNNGAQVLSFTMATVVPGRVRVGVMVDNVGGGGFNPSALRLFQVGGPGDSGPVGVTGALFNDDIPDWIFFDITGATAGSQYELEAFAGTQGIAAVGAVSFDHQALVGSVTNVGAITDLGSGWRTSAIPKSLDGDGNNVLGTDGYYLLGGSPTSSSQPGYVSSWSLTSTTYPGNSLYASIDNPTTTPGSSPTKEQSGTANAQPGSNLGSSILSFVFGQAVPSHVRVGVMIDNLDSVTYNPSYVRVFQVGGVGDSGQISTGSPVYNDSVPDWIFFDIDGAYPGTQYEVEAFGGPLGLGTIGAISFDTVSGIQIGQLAARFVETGNYFSAALAATGGSGSYPKWSVSSGTLPPGLTLAPSGVISGVPTSAGIAGSPYTFSVQATDSTDVTSSPQALSLGVGPITITGSTGLPNATIGYPYSEQYVVGEFGTPGVLTVIGGNPPYNVSYNYIYFGNTSFNITLPTGLSAANGLVLGTPQANTYEPLNSGYPTPTPTGTYTLGFSISDTNGSSAITAYTTLNLTVLPNTTLPPVVSSLTIPAGAVGNAYATQLAAAQGTAPFTWGLASGSSTPPGLSLSPLGVLSGTPTKSIGSPFTFTVVVTDNLGRQSTPQGLSFAVTPVVVNISSLPTGTTGTPYSQTLTASGGTGFYEDWQVTSGSLPSGLTLNYWTGTISGTPTTATTASFGVSVLDSGKNASASVTFYLSVSGTPTGPSITTVTPSSGLAGTPTTIAGSNFGATQGSSTVAFNLTPAVVTQWSASSIHVLVPPSATSGAVVVSVNSVPSNGVQFQVSPSITQLSTSTGVVGANVTITGTNFGSNPGVVSFNRVAATVASGNWSSTAISTTVPTGASTGNLVVTVNGIASSGALFSVLQSPSITSLSPAFGPVASSVTIAGANFGTTQGTSTVTFNGTPAMATTWGSASVVVPVPSGATTGYVVVTVNGEASAGAFFTVSASPTLTLNPSSGPVLSLVTITGGNFGATQGASAVTFNGILAAVPAAGWTATSITVPVPLASTTGIVTVIVNGVPSTSGAFTVIPQSITEYIRLGGRVIAIEQ